MFVDYWIPPDMFVDYINLGTSAYDVYNNGV